MGHVPEYNRLELVKSLVPESGEMNSNNLVCLEKKDEGKIIDFFLDDFLDD